jgi:hypothetical protein
MVSPSRISTGNEPFGDRLERGVAEAAQKSVGGTNGHGCAPRGGGSARSLSRRSALIEAGDEGVLTAWA